MSIPRNLGAFADNVNTNGKVEVTGINATGTPTSSTALLGNGTWGAVTTAPAGSTGQVQYNNAGAFGAISSGTSGQVLTSAGAGSVPTWASPASSGYTLATPINVSGSSVTFTGIPANVRSIIVLFSNIWISSNNLFIQLGTSGGIVTSGYYSSSMKHVPSSSHGSFAGPYGDCFVMYVYDSTAGVTGSYALNLQNATTNNWIGTGLATMQSSLSGTSTGNGRIELNGTLTQLKCFVNSGQSFDAGQINIMYL